MVELVGLLTVIDTGGSFEPTGVFGKMTLGWEITKDACT
jgi:hypothetical protein